MTHEENNTKAKEAITGLLNALNGGDRKEITKILLETILREHRTIQQLFWGVMLKVQMDYADASHDLRNEASVRLAGLVRQVAINNNLDYGLPYV